MKHLNPHRLAENEKTFHVEYQSLKGFHNNYSTWQITDFSAHKVN